MSKESTRLMEIKTAMLLHVPFFASLLLDMMKIHVGKFPHVFPPGNETAATNGKDVWFDEDFLDQLTLPEAVFVTCHEVGHCMWSHLSRGKQYKDMGFEGREFEPRLYNIAGDYVINDMLVEAKIGAMPPNILHDPSRFTQDDLVDDVYRKLEKDPPPPNDDSFDIHILAPDEVGEVEWKRACETAANAAKSMGKLPAGLERFVDKLLNPVVPWQEKLRYHVTRAISREATTWARPNRRRLITQGVVLPSYTGFSAGTVVVAVDTSGSIGQKELTTFLSELQSILDVSKPEAVWVLAIDAKLHDVTELLPGDSVADNPPPLKGGGGSATEPAFNWIEAEGPQCPSALIYFTDMYVSFPGEAPAYPVIWCSTSEGRAAPFGEIIEIDVNKADDDE